MGFSLCAIDKIDCKRKLNEVAGIDRYESRRPRHVNITYCILVRATSVLYGRGTTLNCFLF